MAPWIIERLPAHDHFVEACAGSAAVMAVKPPVAMETLNDIYGEVVNFFRVLRDPGLCGALIDSVAFTPYSLEEFRLAFEPVTGLTNTQQALAFFIRMQMAVIPGRTGWSYSVRGASGWKANKPGRWATMPELLRLAAQRFERVQITNWDVCDLILRLDAPGVLIFIDPPYLDESRPTSTGSSSGYQHDSFDHGAMFTSILKSQHASFAITHYPHADYDAAFQHVGDYISHRNIPNGVGRDQKPERLYVVNRSGQKAVEPLNLADRSL